MVVVVVVSRRCLRLFFVGVRLSLTSLIVIDRISSIGLVSLVSSIGIDLYIQVLFVAFVGFVVGSIFPLVIVTMAVLWIYYYYCYCCCCCMLSIRSTMTHRGFGLACMYVCMYECVRLTRII